MSGETVTTIIGHLTADPELRFTESGTAVANFTVASNPRTFDRQTGEWRDGDPLFLRCTLWRDPAENLAESARKGDRLIVHGRLVQRSFETREGDKRTVIEMQADEVGASTQFATVVITKRGRNGGAAPVDPRTGETADRRTRPPWTEKPQGDAKGQDNEEGPF
ncbi:single-stranded DNA-binding protein [Pseudonocardia sp. ICBG1142]|uniref:single-stranded DNA-binding protein n=1 Tax=Pseudonocardia sp. ICBG1142 TaxID=2846760 RepID=UPI001CF674D9|nr:single-stranded DNA-binding protein [Pseudonocardia sp. ICBG1142]